MEFLNMYNSCYIVAFWSMFFCDVYTFGILGCIFGILECIFCIWVLCIWCLTMRVMYLVF